MKSIYNLTDGDGVSLSSPIRFTNSVNLNYYYGPYGWKDDEGIIHKYFEYKRGTTTTRYPNYATDSTHIHPFGMDITDCFEDDGEGNEIYKSSYVYGYALGCVFLKKIGAAAGTTFGVVKVVDGEEVVVEFIYDGLDTNNLPFAHVKVDTEEIANTVQNSIQDKIPTFIDKEGHAITDLGHYFEEQLDGFVTDSALNSYALTADLFENNAFRMDKMPMDVARASALNSYALTADLFNGNEFRMDKMPMDVARTAALNSYALNSALNSYTLRADVFDSENKIILDKIPTSIARTDNLDALVEPIVVREIRNDTTIAESIQSGIQTALQDNERMTTIVEGVVSGNYLSVAEYSENGEIRLNKIPSTVARKTDIFESGTTMIDINKIPQTILREGALNDYVQSSTILNGSGKLLDGVLPNDVLKDGALNGYVQSSTILNGSGKLIDGIIPNDVIKADYLQHNYVQTATILDGAVLNASVIPGNILKDGDLDGYVQTETIFNGPKLKTGLMPNDVLKDGALDGYLQSSQILGNGGKLLDGVIPSDVLKDSALDDYVQTSTILGSGGKLLDGVLPSDVLKDGALNDYVQSSTILNGSGKLLDGVLPSDVLKDGALNGYLQSNQILGNGGKLLDGVLPSDVLKDGALDGYLQAGTILDGNNKLIDSVIPGDILKNGALDDYVQSSTILNGSGKLIDGVLPSDVLKDGALNGYVQSSTILNGSGKLLDGVLPSDVLKDGALNGYVQTSTILGSGGKLLDGVIPSDIVKDNDLTDYVQTSTILGSGGKLLDGVIPSDVLKDGALNGYVQSSTILNGSGKLLDGVLPSDVLKDGALDNYVQTRELNNYALAADIFDKKGDIDSSKLSTLSSEQIPSITVSKISDIGDVYQTKNGMSAYVQSSKIMNGDKINDNALPSNIARVTDVNEIVNEAIEEINSDEIFSETDEQIHNQTDVTLQKLKAIFSNIQIPEIAIQSIKTNNSTYGYCVLTKNNSSAIMNDVEAFTYSDIKRKINIVDNALKTNQEGKNIYLLPHFSVLNTLVSYTLYNVTERVFNLSKTKFYTYDSTNNQFVRCTSQSQYSSSTKYYTSNEEDFLGVFDCYWVDRTIDFVDTEENANSRVKKLPFLKTVKTTDVAKDEQAYTSAMFTTQYGAVSTNNKVVTTNNVTLYYVLVYDNGERVLSGLNDNHLKMYTNSFGIEVVTELHNGNTMKPLLTGDISGDGIGDLNEEICVIKNKATNEIIETLDVTGNTEYYYEVSSDYNANTYGTTAKNWIENTISWYNTNVWKNDASKNYIYLFCYKDGPAKLSSGTDCYGYYFRAVVYLNGTVSPLDWRPCIPYSLEAKQFNYPTIVDLSGDTTQVGFLPNSEVITFTSTMSTDDRVNKFLYRTAYKDVTETTTHTTPGSPEKRTISLTNGETIEINGLLGTYSDDVVCSNEARFKEPNVAVIDNLTAAAFYQVIRHHGREGYSKVYGLITLSMAAAILYTIREKINDFITSYEISDLLSNVYIDRIRTEYEADEFALYVDSQETQDVINTGLDDIIHNNPYIVEAIAYAILNNIENRGGKYKNFASFFVIDAKDKYTKPQLLVLYNFWNIILKCVKANPSYRANFIELLQTDALDSEGATLITEYLTNRYVLSNKLPEEVGLIKDCSYSPEVPATVTQVTIHKQIENGKEARTITNGGFSNFKYSYNNGGTTEQSWTREWFQNNAIVRFLVKKTNVQKVYEYRKWNKYTKTWIDLGIEQYVDTTGNSGTTPHNPLPTPNSAAERISIRDNYIASEAIATLQNSLVGDMSATNDNVGVLVNRINELTAIINSMTGATSENRLKALTTSDNKRVTVSTESGPTVQGLSSAYQASQDISGASSASPDVTLPDMNTSSVNIEGDLTYGMNYQMFPGLEV